MAISDTSGQDVILERRGLRRSTVFLLGTVGLVIAGAALAYPTFKRWSMADRSFDRSKLRFAEVTRGTLVRDLSVEGKVVASSYPTLYSPAQGTIAVRVRAGERVAQDQILAQLDSPELDSELEQERSTLAALEEELSSQRITARTTRLKNAQDVDLKNLRMRAAQRELQRNEGSFADGIMTKRELEKSRDDAELAKLEHDHAVDVAKLGEETLDHDIRNKEKQLERQTFVVAEALRRVDQLVVKSPVAGVVGSLAVDPTDSVILNQELLTVIDLSAFEIEVSIPETFADEVTLGVPATITYEGADYVGMVSSVSPEVVGSLVGGRVVFTGDQPSTLRQNQRVSTRIILSSLDDVLKVQRGPFLESGGGGLAYLVDGDLASQKTVRTGARSLTEVEIVSGLNAGDAIIISDIARFEGAETVLLRE